MVVLCAASLRATTFYVTVAGIGGEPEYEKKFEGWAQAIDKTVKAADATAKVTTLYGPAATRAHVQAAFEEVAREAKPEDELIVMLIGHGSFDGLEYKMNVPGPDITAADLVAWLNREPPRRQLIANMTSASGACWPALEHANRVVVTATKSGSEKNATVFAGYWVDALRDDSANTDKSGTLSALQAFRYAQEKTAKFYETEKRLATEHAQLKEPAGVTAAGMPLLTLAAAVTTDDPAKTALMKHKQELEAKIDELRSRKAAMEESDYRRQLSSLLVDLAKTQAELDK